MSKSAGRDFQAKSNTATTLSPLRQINGGVLASVTNILHPPLAVSVGNRTLTCERVWTKWWNPDLVLKDDDGEIIKCAYRSRQFQLLRTIDTLPAVVAMFW